MTTKAVQEAVGLLGHEVKDRVTQFVGVVTSVSLDLYGCIQAVVTPKVDKEGKQPDSHWFDVNRLVSTGKKPVMGVPGNFAGKKEEVPGPAAKPARRY